MKLVMSYNFHYTMLAVYFYSTVLLSFIERTTIKVLRIQ